MEWGSAEDGFQILKQWSSVRLWRCTAVGHT